MLFVLVPALLALAAAQPPVWYPSGACGMSKYPDAGNNCTFGTGPCAANEAGVLIVGGIEASQGEFPFMVSLRDNTDNNAPTCGGSILNERWILTSAFCSEVLFAGDHTRIQVAVGVHSQTTPAPNEAFYDVEDVIPFEGFTWVSGIPNDNNMALLYLTMDIAMNEDVSPVCAPDPALDYATGIDVKAMGWGETVRNGPEADTLRYAGLRTFTNSYCVQEYALLGDVITDGMICASDNGNHEDRDLCEGDMGGPMVYKDGNVFRQVGIASFEQRCANGYPGVFTDVSHPNINSWISSKMVNRTTSAGDDWDY